MVLAQAAQERETAIAFGRGLFLLRYATGAAKGRSPLAIVRPAPDCLPYVEVIAAPGIVAGFLSTPGDCAVVRAEQAGSLLVKIVAQNVGDPLEASFRLEPLSGAVQPAAVAPAPPPVAVAQKPNLTIFAHVSRRGDIEAGPGAWIGGPEAPAPIEGLQVGGVFPDGLSMDIQPLLRVNPLRWLDWAPAGVFVGTRGRALSLSGLRLRLSGPSASFFVICADALFLGSPVMSRRGREIELVGAAGGDPLVGLRLEVAPAETLGLTAPGGANGAVAVADSRPEPRIKLFKRRQAIEDVALSTGGHLS